MGQLIEALRELLQGRRRGLDELLFHGSTGLLPVMAHLCTPIFPSLGPQNVRLDPRRRAIQG